MKLDGSHLPALDVSGSASPSTANGSLSPVTPTDALEQSSPNSRPRMTAEQTQFLEAHFERNPKPSTSEKEAIAAQMGVSTARVVNWFQNHRAKVKGMQRDIAARTNTVVAQNDLAAWMSNPQYRHQCLWLLTRWGLILESFQHNHFPLGQGVDETMNNPSYQNHVAAQANKIPTTSEGWYQFEQYGVWVHQRLVVLQQQMQALEAAQLQWQTRVAHEQAAMQYRLRLQQEQQHAMIAASETYSQLDAQPIIPSQALAESSPMSSSQSISSSSTTTELACEGADSTFAHSQIYNPFYLLPEQSIGKLGQEQAQALAEQQIAQYISNNTYLDTSDLLFEPSTSMNFQHDVSHSTFTQPFLYN